MIPLANSYNLKVISAEELSLIQTEHLEKAFANRTEAPLHWKVSDAAQAKINIRKKDNWELRLGLFFKDSPVGWHYGLAVDAETYYMKNSAVIKAHRGRGLYSQMLKEILSLVAAEQFQVVTSLHHPNNAGVIVPKLKSGFVISGMQVHERFRFLVEMKYFFDPERRESMNRQIGLCHP